MSKNGFRLDAFDWENLSVKNACALLFSGRRALDTEARRFPGVYQKLPRSFPEASRSRQIAKIWPQKAPGQDLAENGRFPIVLEGAFNCGLEARKLPKSGSKRLPARIWPKNGRFTIVLEGAFNCGLEARKLPKSGSKRFPARIWYFKTSFQGAFLRFQAAKTTLEASKTQKRAPSEQKRLPARRVRLGKSFREKRLCLAVLWPPRA